MLDKISNLDKQNIKKLKSFEKQIKEKQEEIKLKKNIISENEIDKEINQLKVKINDYKIKKDKMVKDFNEIKKKELKIFFDKINPVVQNYMNEKSIDILFNSNHIFMGNKNSDLTKQLIDEINNKFSN